jgi:hypothetical protein
MANASSVSGAAWMLGRRNGIAIERLVVEFKGRQTDLLSAWKLESHCRGWRIKNFVNQVSVPSDTDGDVLAFVKEMSGINANELLRHDVIYLNFEVTLMRYRRWAKNSPKYG